MQTVSSLLRGCRGRWDLRGSCGAGFFPPRSWTEREEGFFHQELE